MFCLRHHEAVTWQGKNEVSVDIVAKPVISHPKDVIVRVTACSICSGSDGHIFGGEVPCMDKGDIIGHGCMGIIEQVGAEVKKFLVGTRVVVAFGVACGECVRCKNQEFSGCVATNDSKLAEKTFGQRTWALFGYGRILGSVNGSQGEFVRVPYGDVNCYAVPDDVPDEKALFLSDVASTALHGTEIGKVREGDNVVIFGLGPVGLLTARWCQIKKAKRIIAIDMVPERLALAVEKLGIEIIDRSKLSSQDVINRVQELLPEGADVAIEAVGYRYPMSLGHKIAPAAGVESDTPEIIDECLTVIRPYGHVALIGTYIAYAHGFPIGKVMFKHATLVTGQAPVQRYFDDVMAKIQSNEFDPSFIISHRIRLDEAPKAYEKLNNKEGGYIKMFMRP